MIKLLTILTEIKKVIPIPSTNEEFFKWLSNKDNREIFANFIIKIWHRTDPENNDYIDNDIKVAYIEDAPKFLPEYGYIELGSSSDDWVGVSVVPFETPKELMYPSNWKVQEMNVLGKTIYYLPS